MEKTLLIKIFNNNTDKFEREDILIMDCKLFDSFQTFVGYEMIDNLYDTLGTPLFQIIQKPSELISDYISIDKSHFHFFIKQWNVILYEILKDGNNIEKEFTFQLSQDYINWLKQSNNKYFSHVGNTLSDSGKTSIKIQSLELFNEIISNQIQKIKKFLSHEKCSTFVIDNQQIGASSYFVKSIMESNSNLTFFRYDQWITEYNNYHKETTNTKKDYQQEIPITIKEKYTINKTKKYDCTLKYEPYPECDSYKSFLLKFRK